MLPAKVSSRFQSICVSLFPYVAILVKFMIVVQAFKVEFAGWGTPDSDCLL